MSDGKQPETIGTRCQPELVEEFDQFKNEEGYGSRSEALRAVVIEKMEEREENLITAKEVLSLEPVRAGSGLALMILGGALAVLMIALMSWVVLSGEFRLLWDDAVVILGLIAVPVVFLFAPGAVLYHRATEKAASRKRVLKRQARAERLGKTADLTNPEG